MNAAAKIVEDYLRVLMIPDPEGARRYCAPEMEIRFTGSYKCGEWPDGTNFEGNRYVDRYVVRRGKIEQMDVWDDSAEWLLVRAGVAKP